MFDDLITVRQAAEQLKCNRRTILRLIWKKQLPGFQVANRWRLRQSELEAYVKRQMNAPVCV